jgi:hypothetical protein
MKKIPCPITSDRLSELYTKSLLTDEQIAEVLCKEGYDATKKRVDGEKIIISLHYKDMKDLPHQLLKVN